MVQNQWICAGLLWSKWDQALTMFTGIPFQIHIHSISPREPPVHLLELNRHAPRTCTTSNTPPSRDILVTASHISYVNYWLTHICVHACLQNTEDQDEMYFLFRRRNGSATRIATFKNYQPVLVAKKIHITPICKKPSEKLYIMEWLNL